MSERSITIIIWNHTKATLSRVSVSATSGTVTLPSGETGATLTSTISLPPEGFMKFVASNSNGGCVGTITVSDKDHTTGSSTVVFPVNYVHPSTNDPTTVTVQPTTTYAACMGQSDQESLSGHDVTVNMGLYVGCPVPILVYNPNNGAFDRKTAGYVVPLLGAPYFENNPRDLVNSLFQPAVRTGDTVSIWSDQANAAPYQPADFSGGQLAINNSADPLATIPIALKNLWPGVESDPNKQSPDYAIIKFIADFLVPESLSATNVPLVMYVPKFVYQRYNSSGVTGPVYQLTGYEAYPFAGLAPEAGGTAPRFNMKSVDVFLQLLAGGAHFVNIQAERDFKNLNPTDPPANTGRDLYTMFKAQFPDNNTMSGRRSCPGNSHYAFKVNTSGWYYGNQSGEWAASGCGLLLSLLVAKTADGPYDTFMQLEGWPAESFSLTGGARHGADYDAYTKSYWNISTFGATPYSEKRATTIFLAPAAWTPKIYAKTYMMPYVGAETPQGWLKTELVSVPPGTPDPPSQYGG
jgi:hypothetical protein